MDILKEIDWTTIADEDIPCSKFNEGFNNENLWMHPSGQVRPYKNWWYLDDDGFPANAVDGGFLIELKDTAELSKHMDKVLAKLNTDRLQ